MQQIATKLKLSAEASETAILAEVDQLLNRATAAEAERDTLKARVTGLEESAKTLTTENKELRNRQVDQDLESYADCFKPEDKEKTKTLLITNRAGTIDLFKSFRVLRDEAVKAGPQAIHNRANTGNPGGVGGAPDPIKTFETEFEKELKAGKSKAEAIRILLNRAPDIYRAWLAAGGSKRL